jgi:hypothetical protein
MSLTSNLLDWWSPFPQQQFSKCYPLLIHAQSAEVAACKIPEIFRQKLFQFLVADARFCHSDFLSGLILFLGNILVD